jgi:uncharacterized protein (DUF362 family)
MKKNSFRLFVTLCITLVIFSPALAGPKVAIVKSNNLPVEDYKFDMAIIRPYDFSKPIEKLLPRQAHWGPERQAAIEKMVREAIKLAGDWPVTPGKTVFIKPNLVVDNMFLLASQRTKSEEILSTITDPRVVRAVALVALESGAKKVMFGDLPASGDSYATALAWGYETVAKELNQKFPGKVELVDLKSVPYKFYPAKKTGGLALKEYAIPEILVNSDIRISVPIMKTHSMAVVTLSLKNMGIGAVTPSVYGSFKLGLPHQRLWEVIVDVCNIVPIDYAVVSALWGMEGSGPLLGNPVAMNTIIAGKDPVAVDWVGAECMGIKGDLIVVTRMAQKYGLGTYQDVQVVGVPIQQAMQQFDPIPRAKRSPVYNRMIGWEPGTSK